ncbi:hypothetical protein LXL04_024639 [Taraxacum kok-saghyz]
MEINDKVRSRSTENLPSAKGPIPRPGRRSRPMTPMAVPSHLLRVKTSAVCGPYLQSSTAEEVDQTSAVCKKKAMLEGLRSGQSMFAPRRGRTDIFRVIEINGCQRQVD